MQDFKNSMKEEDEEHAGLGLPRKGHFIIFF